MQQHAVEAREQAEQTKRDAAAEVKLAKEAETKANEQLKKANEAANEKIKELEQRVKDLSPAQKASEQLASTSGDSDCKEIEELLAVSKNLTPSIAVDKGYEELYDFIGLYDTNEPDKVTVKSNVDGSVESWGLKYMFLSRDGAKEKVRQQYVKLIDEVLDLPPSTSLDKAKVKDKFAAWNTRILELSSKGHCSFEKRAELEVWRARVERMVNAALNSSRF